MCLAVLDLGVDAFSVGLAEVTIQGVLHDISADFGVSIPITGLVVTGYAVSVAVGGPILVILVNRLARKAALLALLGLFTIGNVLSAVAPSFCLLMSARHGDPGQRNGLDGVGRLLPLSARRPMRSSPGRES